MDYKAFYAQLFRPVRERIGPIDEMTIAAIVGFDCGGPVSLATVGYGKEDFVSYITCELAVREQQRPAAFGRYEFMMTCDDEEWARKILTTLGQMSLTSAFGHGHTIEIGAIVSPGCALQGLVLEEFSRATIDGGGYGILRAIGVTRSQLEFAMENGTEPLTERLKLAGLYPLTIVRGKCD